MTENHVYGFRRAIIDPDTSAPLILDTGLIAVLYSKIGRHPGPIATKKGKR